MKLKQRRTGLVLHTQVCPTYLPDFSGLPGVGMFFAASNVRGRFIYLVRRGDHLVAALEVDPELQTVPSVRAARHLSVNNPFALQTRERKGQAPWSGRLQGQTTRQTRLHKRTHVHRHGGYPTPPPPPV